MTAEDRRSAPPMYNRGSEDQDQKTRRPEDQKTRRPEGQKTRRPEDQRTRRPGYQDQGDQDAGMREDQEAKYKYVKQGQNFKC
ncbi:hypothetical protein PMIN05_000745 [Paraphaeosphaeria minitans]